MKKILFSCIVALLATLSVYGDAVQEEATRMEAIKVLFQAAENAVTYSETELYTILVQFTDTWTVDKSDRQALAYAIKTGVIQGYPDETIKPYSPITRAEYAAIIMRCNEHLWFGFDDYEELTSSNVQYADVEEWSAEGISFCMTRGIMMGYGDRFGSDDNLTAEQLETISRRVVFGPSSAERATLRFLNADVKLNASYVVSLPFEGDAKLNIQEVVANKRPEIYMSIKADIPEMEQVENLHVLGDSAAVRMIKTATQYVEEKSKASAGNSKFESVFISDFNNIYEDAMPPFSSNTVKGYEYFIYYDGDFSVSDEYEIGKWYRRPVEFHSSRDGRIRYPNMGTVVNDVKYYPAELLDESFYAKQPESLE